MPQFIHPDTPQLPQNLIFTVTMVICNVIVLWGRFAVVAKSYSRPKASEGPVHSQPDFWRTPYSDGRTASLRSSLNNPYPQRSNRPSLDQLSAEQAFSFQDHTRCDTTSQIERIHALLSTSVIKLTLYVHHNPLHLIWGTMQSILRTKVCP